jgi:hypothetical protein
LNVKLFSPQRRKERKGMPGKKVGEPKWWRQLNARVPLLMIRPLYLPGRHDWYR